MQEEYIFIHDALVKALKEGVIEGVKIETEGTREHKFLKRTFQKRSREIKCFVDNVVLFNNRLSHSFLQEKKKHYDGKL